MYEQNVSSAMTDHTQAQRHLLFNRIYVNACAASLWTAIKQQGEPTASAHLLCDAQAECGTHMLFN